MRKASIPSSWKLATGLIAWTALALSDVSAQGQEPAKAVAQCRFDNPQTLAARTPGCVIEGTWAFQGIEGPLGDTITFNADGTWAGSQYSTGTYKVIGNSILIDVNDDDATNYFAWTYLGTLADGQLIFSFQNTLGFKPLP